MSKINVNQIRNLPSGGSGGGITIFQHETLRQLIHLADGVGGPFEGFVSGAYREQNSSIMPTLITWYSDIDKTHKIVQKSITYMANTCPSIIRWSVYDSEASLVATITDNISYSGMFETNRVRTVVEIFSDFNLTAVSHRTARQLIHLADGVGGPFEGFPSGSYRETLPAGSPFPESITWYNNTSRDAKIMEKLIEYGDKHFPLTITWKVYDTSGTIALISVSDAIYYNGILEASRTRTYS